MSEQSSQLPELRSPLNPGLTYRSRPDGEEEIHENFRLLEDWGANTVQPKLQAAADRIEDLQVRLVKLESSRAFRKGQIDNILTTLASLSARIDNLIQSDIVPLRAELAALQEYV